MKKLIAALLVSAMVLGLAACSQTQPQPSAPAAEEAPVSLQTMYDGYMDAVSPDFAYDIALELTTNPAYFNSELGGRNAGSDAEHAAEYHEPEKRPENIS